MNAHKSFSNPAFRRSYGRWQRRLGFALLVILILALPTVRLLAGVLVAPTVVIMSDQERTSRMIIRNPSAEPKEVEIRMGFGIPVSDSLGNIQVDLLDTLTEDPRSCKNWVKVFPRKLVLPPSGSQTIRFIASPPKGLDDGEYWARVIIRSQESKVRIPSAAEGQITTNLNMIMQTAISLKFRTGELHSQLAIGGAEAKLEEHEVKLLVDLINQGNVSYVGVLNCRLLDAKNKELGYKRVDLAVYRDLKRAVSIPFNADADRANVHHVEIFITNEGRTDLDPRYRIRGNEIEYSMVLD